MSHPVVVVSRLVVSLSPLVACPFSVLGLSLVTADSEHRRGCQDPFGTPSGEVKNEIGLLNQPGMRPRIHRSDFTLRGNWRGRATGRETPRSCRDIDHGQDDAHPANEAQ